MNVTKQIRCGRFFPASLLWSLPCRVGDLLQLSLSLSLSLGAAVERGTSARRVVGLHAGLALANTVLHHRHPSMAHLCTCFQDNCHLKGLIIDLLLSKRTENPPPQEPSWTPGCLSPATRDPLTQGARCAYTVLILLPGDTTRDWNHGFVFCETLMCNPNLLNEWPINSIIQLISKRHFC